MLLIDSLYVNSSGGLVLLKYLITEMEKTKFKVHYLIDDRCADEFMDIVSYKKSILKANIRNRIHFYKLNSNKFNKILCFGNIPPPIKLNSIVYTYFHNIFLLESPPGLNLKNKFVLDLKRFYINLLKNNTNFWIVQTTNTKDTLIKSLKEKQCKIYILPFYDILQNINHNENNQDFVYIANYTKEKNHKNLLLAWEKLYNQGIIKKLHLTIGDTPKSLNNQISRLIKSGVPIINHGIINREEINEVYSKCKATIYPSINESFGLGIIEATSYNCDVIGPDLPYIYSVCNPSFTFDPFDVDSIVNAVIDYENNPIKTEVIIKNEIKSLMNLLI